MKIKFIITFIIVSVCKFNAQVGINTNNPHESSIIELKSETKGFLIPRIMEEEFDEIKEPKKGLMLFCINCNERGCLKVNIGTEIIPNWYCLRLQKND